MRLSDAQIELYSRQILLRELGGTGQRRLLETVCLILGAFPEAEPIATYLSGAGVGCIDLAPLDATASHPASAFAPIERRNPDVRVARLPVDRAIDLGRYDVAILALGAHAGPDGSRLRSRARRGTVVLRESPPGSHELLLLPASASGCFACVRLVPPSVPPEAMDDPLMAPVGAALAALAALRWLAELTGESGTRALVLPPGGEIWREAQTQPLARCPRGCRP